MTSPVPVPDTTKALDGERFSGTKGAVVGLVVLIGVGAIAAGLYAANLALMLAALTVVAVSFSSVRVADQWQKAVILRLGHYHRTVGPGLFFLIPLVDRVAAWVDQRVAITTFNAEQTLTRDTVPVDVDAVMFWMVWDPDKAAMEVADYREAVSWAAQTALREVIGRTDLSDMLAAREHLDEELVKIIDRRTEPWGVAVQAVEIRDVKIPLNLQEAMSREAQAERERQARVILGNAEKEIAHNFAEAAKAYIGNETALQLRAMNILYEGLKEKGALVVVPSSAVETMGLGTISGLSSMAKEQLSAQNNVAQSQT